MARSHLSIAIISLFPEMFTAITESGITRRAVKEGLVEFTFFNPREFTTDKHETVDDRPYGGGPGMVMLVEPLAKAVLAARQWHRDRQAAGAEAETEKVIYLSPQGRQFTDAAADELLTEKRLTLIAGRYEGVDQRFIDSFVDEEWSIGDYVLSGGELPAMVMLDAMIRKLPGALGDAQSAVEDSFVNGLLDCPHYTRPVSLPEVAGHPLTNTEVPQVLLSGDHKKIASWRTEQSLRRTLKRRPDLVDKADLDDSHQALLTDIVRQHKDADGNA